MRVRMKIQAAHLGKGFTLVELSVVIAVVAIVGGVLIAVINPTELVKHSRDSTRLTQAAELNKAVSLFRLEKPTASIGESGVVYVSIPDSSATCSGIASQLPSLAKGWQYRCAPNQNTKKTDGTGWIPIDFASLPAGSPFAELPVDPSNSAMQKLFFAYAVGNGYVITAALESERFQAEAVNDGGSDNNRIEMGSNLALWKDIRGKNYVAYWSLDEGTGVVASDSSDNANHGTLTKGTLNGNPPAWIDGKVGKAVSFTDSGAGVSYIEIPHAESFNVTEAITLEAWVRRDNTNGDNYILSKNSITGGNFEPYGLRVVGGYAEFYLCRASAPCGTARANTITITRDNWYHIVGTYDNNEQTTGLAKPAMKIYVNGALRATGSAWSLMSTNNGLIRIGRLGSGIINSAVLKGEIDEVRIYDRALTAEEILEHYNDEK